MILLGDRQSDIYIKRGPKIYEFSEELNKKLELLRKMEDKKPVTESAIEALEFLKKHSGEKDYSGCDTFWLVKDNGVAFELSQPNVVNGKTISYSNFDDMYKDFIDLREFLEEAEYVGRKYQYPEDPKEVSMNGLENIEYERTLLYKTNDIWIVHKKSRSGLIDKFEILRRSNEENFDYEFYGEPTDEFKDKTELYEAIYKKLTSNPTKIV